MSQKTTNKKMAKMTNLTIRVMASELIRNTTDKFMVGKAEMQNNKEVSAQDAKKQRRIVNNKYLNRLREEGEGLPELRVI